MPGYTKSAADFAGGGGRLAGGPLDPGRAVARGRAAAARRRPDQALVARGRTTLAEDGWRGIAIDFRGHGDSDRAADGRYRVDAMTEDVLRVIDAIGEGPVIIGASLGGLRRARDRRGTPYRAARACPG